MRAAGAAFAAIGMPEIAADGPTGVAELERYRAAGLAWVITVPGAGVTAGRAARGYPA